MIENNENLINNIAQPTISNNIVPDCTFCNLDKSKFEVENQFSYVVSDLHPVTKLHTLVIPKRHIADFFGLEQIELISIYELLQETRAKIQAIDPTVTGFNIGTNAGTDAGQSVAHAHIHLIPRRNGDTSLTINNPNGGVRWSVPNRHT